VPVERALVPECRFSESECPLELLAAAKHVVRLEIDELLLALDTHREAPLHRDEEAVPDVLLALPTFFARVIDLGHERPCSTATRGARSWRSSKR
jgi:hypothetical protein